MLCPKGEKARVKGEDGDELVTIEVDASSDGERIDRYLASQSNTVGSRSQVQVLIREGRVRVNDQPCYRASTRVSQGQCITVQVPSPQADIPQPETLPLDIVFEDDHIMVVNKARGMVVHPAPGHSGGTLVNALLAHSDRLADVGDAERPGIVHRLDKETSGLMLVAKSERAYTSLVQQLKARAVGRHYVAFIHGVAKDDRWTVDAPIGRDPNQRQRMAVVADGKPATTHLAVIERYPKYTFASAELVTGRTHQIRVHCAYMGHPIVGDVRYGGKAGVFASGQALHAARLAFEHPITHREMSFEAPLPPELEALKAQLRQTKT